MKMFCEIVAILLFIGVSNTLHYQDPYTIPKPRIEVLKPRGFRISIEDSPGISQVAFYVNINKELNIEESINCSGNRYAFPERWTCDEPNTVLKNGDVVNYEMVITQDHLYYRSGKNSFLYRDDQESTTTESPNNQLATCKSCKKNIETSVFPTTQPPKSTYSQAHTWEHFAINCSQTLLTVQSKLETLSKINQQLISFIEKYPDTKILTLSGRIPPDDEPIKTVNFIVNEKLDLNPSIIWAVKSHDNNIKFQVDNLLDKLEILEVAKENLKHSKIFIS